MHTLREFVIICIENKVIKVGVIRWKQLICGHDLVSVRYAGKRYCLHLIEKNQKNGFVFPPYTNDYLTLGLMMRKINELRRFDAVLMGVCRHLSREHITDTRASVPNSLYIRPRSA